MTSSKSIRIGICTNINPICLRVSMSCYNCEPQLVLFIVLFFSRMKPRGILQLVSCCLSIMSLVDVLSTEAASTFQEDLSSLPSLIQQFSQQTEEVVEGNGDRRRLPHKRSTGFLAAEEEEQRAKRDGGEPW